MSIRVMVVDDEPIAAQATSVMVRRADPAFEVAGVCYSGRNAVSQAAALRPDIVVMDIQMTGINGLEAIKRIRDTAPHIRFVVLSAHSEFSYAVEALTLGASDYLLKPVRQVRLTATLQKVAADILARKECMDLELRLQERLQIAEPMIRKDFLRSLVPQAGADERLLACASFLGLDERPCFALALGRRGENPIPAPDAWIDSPQLPAGMILDVVRPDLAVGVAPVAGGARGEEEVLAQLDQLLCSQAGGRDMLVGAGRACIGAIPLKTSLLQAMGALQHLRGSSSGARSASFSPDRMESFPDEPGKGARDAVLSSVQQITERATRFIEENYRRELQLDEVAAHVNLSPYYFSRLFKEHSGVNFTELLLQIRIEKAKKLLTEPGSSVKHVAFQVGYHDPNYFSKVFRKVTGIKASDYRAIHRETAVTGEGRL